MTEEKSERLLSLDIFRGLTIAAMILVNNPGSWSSVYAPLRHAEWHGCTPTDLVFPFFLFIVGGAITLSLQKRKERGDHQTQLMLQIVRRTIIIFALGLFLNGFPYFELSTLRIPGVLQRIAIVYFFASLLFLKTDLRIQGLVGIALLILYWAVMTLIPVPGVGYANLEPGKNLAAWLDHLLLPGHLWSSSKVWDPEGLLSTLPAISTAILGIFLGHGLMSKASAETKAAWIFVAGNFCLVLGLIWDGLFPINKNIWTSSYVLYTGGLALNVFGMCFWLADVKKYTWWTKPFVVYGMNAIVVYVLSGLMARLSILIQVTNALGKEVTLKTYLYERFFTSWLSPFNASLGWAVVQVSICLGLMWILFIKKIFVKI